MANENIITAVEVNGVIYHIDYESLANLPSGGNGSSVTPVTTISNSSTDAQIPSAKAVWELVQSLDGNLPTTVTTITSSSTDTQIPSAKAVWNLFNSLQQNTLTLG